MSMMEAQKTWTFNGNRLTAFRILRTCSVEQMQAGNWEIVPNINRMGATIIVPTLDDDIVVDLLGRGKVLLKTSPMASKLLRSLTKELAEKRQAQEDEYHAQVR